MMERVHHTLPRTPDPHAHNDHIIVKSPDVVQASSVDTAAAGRAPVSSGVVLPMGNYAATASTSPNAPISERTSYHHARHIQDISPFSKESHAATAISC
jgi:hypothetical protein